MSFRHMQAVIENSKTTGPDRAIMLALAYRANDTGACWPSLETLGKDSGLNRRSVYRRLPFIVALGELAIDHRGVTVDTQGGGRQTSNLYTITLQARDCVSLPRKGGTDEPHRKGHTVPQVGTHSPPGRDTQSPESSINPHLIKKKKEGEGERSLSVFDPAKEKEIKSVERIIRQAEEIGTAESLKEAEKQRRKLAKLKGVDAA